MLIVDRRARWSAKELMSHRFWMKDRLLTDTKREMMDEKMIECEWELEDCNALYYLYLEKCGYYKLKWPNELWKDWGLVLSDKKRHVCCVYEMCDETRFEFGEILNC